jgi:hypothetical protein
MPPIAPRPRQPIGYLAALVVVVVLIGPAAGASAATSKSTTTTTDKSSSECSASQLIYAITLDVAGVKHEGGFVMSVTNVSEDACRIHGYPSLRFYTSAGRLLTFGTAHASVTFRSVVPHVITLSPNANAYFEVTKASCTQSVRFVSSFFYVITPYTKAVPWVGHLKGVRPFDYCDASSRASDQRVAVSAFVTSPSLLLPK